VSGSFGGWVRGKVADPRVTKHLLIREGEIVIDEVRHHWVVYLFPGFEALAVLMVLAAAITSPVDSAWVPLTVALVLGLHALWGALNDHMDRFVITNMRVFRVRGVLDQRTATMPIARILDITVDKPLLGRIFGYGHFTFESAAQEQGIREIRYIGRPDDRDLTIQSVIQRAGLRAMVRGSRDEDDGSDDTAAPDDEPPPAPPRTSGTASSRPVRSRPDHARLHPIYRPDDPRGRTGGRSRPGS
jgi:hypothetical protein